MPENNVGLSFIQSLKTILLIKSIQKEYDVNITTSKRILGSRTKPKYEDLDRQKILFGCALQTIDKVYTRAHRIPELIELREY